MEELSLLHPAGIDPEYHRLTDAAVHDLAVDGICEVLTQMAPERNLIRRTLSNLSADPRVIRYRCDVFEDILRFPGLRDELKELFDRVDFLRTYGSFRKEFDDAGIWELAHRLGEMDEYITAVDAIYQCLNEKDICAEGLLALKAYVKELYEDSGFEALQKDIKKLKLDASEIRSVTLGVNLNDRFEPNGIGIVSINNKYFTKSGLISSFCDFLNRGDEIQKGTEWKNRYSYRPADGDGSLELLSNVENMAQIHAVASGGLTGMAAAAGIASASPDMRADDVVYSLNRAATAMLSGTVRKLKALVSRHVNVSMHVISGLIPELMYYIRWAEYVEKLQKKGFRMCKPEVADWNPEAAEGSSREIEATEKSNRKTEAAEKSNRNSEAAKEMNRNFETAAETDQPEITEETEQNSCDRILHARGLYNLRLVTGEASAVVPNDLDFDREHRIYILTGANRGGKTMITQGIGIAFLLAQGGIYVPADRFVFSPVDSIFTHFPADENQTLDLGRLGEESKRFREIYLQGTSGSLFLLNESFSTTSFEEGYYIAYDAVRALRDLGARTIYNTHMHKLARSLDELNSEGSGDSLVASLVAENEEGQRSYKVRVAPPQGFSFAYDIARKYGVTYEQLTERKL